MRGQILKVLAAILLIMIFVISFSFSGEKSKEIEINLQNKIINEINQLNIEDFQNYLDTNEQLLRNPYANIFAIEYGEKKWGEALKTKIIIYHYLANSYVEIGEFDKAFQSLRKSYPVFHEVNTKDITKKQWLEAERDVHAVKYLGRKVQFNIKLESYIFDKVKKMMANEKKYDEPQKKVISSIIKFYEDRENEKMKEEKELAYIKKLAKPHFEKLSIILTNKDKDALKKYLNESLFSKGNLDYLCEAIYEAFYKYNNIEFRIQRIVKKSNEQYRVFYSWEIDGVLQKLKDNEVEYSDIIFILKNEKLFISRFN